MNISGPFIKRPIGTSLLAAGVLAIGVLRKPAPLFPFPFKGKVGMGMGLSRLTHPHPYVATLGHPALAKQPGPRHPASRAHRRANQRFASASIRPHEGEVVQKP
jgi:hypothetical protein